MQVAHGALGLDGLAALGAESQVRLHGGALVGTGLAVHERGPDRARHAHYQDVVQNAMKVQGGAAIASAVAALEQRSFRIHFHCWSQTEFLRLLAELQERAGFPRFDVAEFVANEREMVVVLKRL